MVEEMLAFWQARLDELEAAAKLAAGETAADWFADAQEGWDPDERSVKYTGPSTLRPGSTSDYPVCRDMEVSSAEHIAEQDPARVLRRVQAQRAVIEECVRALGYPKNVPFANLARRVIAASVAEWAGHPEFRAEWVA